MKNGIFGLACLPLKTELENTKLNFIVSKSVSWSEREVSAPGMETL